MCKSMHKFIHCDLISTQCGFLLLQDKKKKNQMHFTIRSANVTVNVGLLLLSVSVILQQ